MKYELFLQQIKNEITKQVPKSNLVILNTVLKNNDCKLDAISIIEPESTITPNIYLDQYYEQYQSGRDLSSIAELIIKLSKDRTEVEKEFIPDISDFASIKHLIIYRLVNWHSNIDRLRSMPYKDIEDLVVIYSILIKVDNEGISSIPITDSLMESWFCIGTDQIDECAKRNTPKLFPVTIRSMSDVIKDIVTKDIFNNSTDNMIQEDFNEILNMPNTNQRDQEMYVISNDRGINGAGTLLYPSILHDFATNIKKNFYILPSSIHECILVPDNDRMNKAVLKEMVMDINESQVPTDEILSNEVYYYDLAINKFKLIAD